MEFSGEPNKQYYLRITSKVVEDSFASNLYGFNFSLHANEKLNIYQNQKQKEYFLIIPVTFRQCVAGEITINNALMYCSFDLHYLKIICIWTDIIVILFRKYNIKVWMIA